MQADTALTPFGILGVDVANLSMRCAVYQAAAEEILIGRASIDRPQWEKTTIGEGEDTGSVTTHPPDSGSSLDHLLDA